MRVVAGSARGRRISAPPGSDTRPTTDRVREAVFNALGSLGAVEGAVVVDLFAGSGALGLEALSRGASTADFVETRPASLHSLRANIAALRLRDRTRVFKRDALEFASRLEPDSYAIAFADPPYESRMLDRVIDIWRERGFAAILTVEHAADHPLMPGGHRHLFDTTAVTTYRLGS